MISVLWKHLIEKHGGKITSALDLSSLSKISDGYTPGHMIQAIQQVITKRRILLQEKRPLTAIEFVAPLAQFSPVFQEEEEALKVLVWFCLMERSLWHLVKYKATSFVLCVRLSRNGMQRLPWERSVLRLLQKGKRNCRCKLKRKVPRRKERNNVHWKKMYSNMCNSDYKCTILHSINLVIGERPAQGVPRWIFTGFGHNSHVCFLKGAVDVFCPKRAAELL